VFLPKPHCSPVRVVHRRAARRSRGDTEGDPSWYRTGRQPECRGKARERALSVGAQLVRAARLICARERGIAGGLGIRILRSGASAEEFHRAGYFGERGGMRSVCQRRNSACVWCSSISDLAELAGCSRRTVDRPPCRVLRSDLELMNTQCGRPFNNIMISPSNPRQVTIQDLRSAARCTVSKVRS
jgi:hypothetical protein